MSNIIYQSHNKMTKVYIEDNLLVKEISTESKDFHLFTKEVFYYESFSGTVSPKLISSSLNIMKTELLPKGTLLEQLKLNADVNKEELLLQTLASLNAFNNANINIRKKEINKFVFFSFSCEFIKKALILLFSGPKNSEKSKILSKKNKLFISIVKPILFLLGSLTYFLLKVCRSKLLGKRYHGDLHLNNILVKNTGEILFIDFENVEEFSGKYLDVLFFFTIYVGFLEPKTIKKMTEILFSSMSFSFVDRIVWKASFFITKNFILRNSKFKSF
jgi:hypothetical protein